MYDSLTVGVVDTKSRVQNPSM